MAPQHPPTPPAPAQRVWLAAGLVTAAVILAYWNSLSGALVYDDRVAITENGSIRHLWPVEPILTPPAESGTGGRPVANLTFALSYAFSGVAPSGHHLVNIGIHALTALALLGVVRRTLARGPLAPRFARDSLLLATLAAALWAVHPLLTQTVTYLSQRTEGLMALFYLTTLYCLIRGSEARPKVWYPLSVAACLLGALSKEVIATLPVVAFLYDRTFLAGSFHQAWRARWKLYVALLATWIPLAIVLQEVKQRGVGYGLGITWRDYAFTECKAVLLYLKLSVWPDPLIFDRGIVLTRSITEALPFVILLAILLAATVWALRRFPILGFCGAFFFIVLSPTSSVVPVIQQPIAENRAYLPSAAIIVLLTASGYAIFNRRVIVAASVGLLALNVALTLRRNRDYASEITLWTDTIEKCPQNERAHYNLGVAYNYAGRISEAMAEYEATLRLNPDYVDAHSNLGNLLNEADRPAEALPHLEMAVRLRPTHVNAQYNLGNSYLKLGRQLDARRQFERTLRLNPKMEKAENNLGAIAHQQGHMEEARVHFEAALRAKPDYPDALTNLGAVLFQFEGSQNAAISYFEAALKLDPNYLPARNNLALSSNQLGTKSIESGDFAAAKAHFERVVWAVPQDSIGHNNLGVVYLRTKRFAEAIACFERALKLQPDYPAAQAALAEAKAGLGAQPR